MPRNLLPTCRYTTIKLSLIWRTVITRQPVSTACHYTAMSPFPGIWLHCELWKNTVNYASSFPLIFYGATFEIAIYLSVILGCKVTNAKCTYVFSISVRKSNRCKCKRYYAQTQRCQQYLHKKLKMYSRGRNYIRIHTYFSTWLYVTRSSKIFCTPKHKVDVYITPEPGTAT